MEGLVMYSATDGLVGTEGRASGVVRKGQV